MFLVRDDADSAVSGYALAPESYWLDETRVGYRLLAHVTFTLLLVAVAFAAIALCV